MCLLVSVRFVEPTFEQPTGFRKERRFVGHSEFGRIRDAALSTQKTEVTFEEKKVEKKP